MRVSATARFGVPHAPTPPPRPLAVSLDGEIHGLDQEAELTLTVRNRTPRTLPAPRVEVVLPTGAELSVEDPRYAVTGTRVQLEEDVVEIHLPPLLPGRSRSVPLPVRWSVAGRLRGLGVAARASERGEVTVLPPRTIEIRREEASQ